MIRKDNFTMTSKQIEKEYQRIKEKYIKLYLGYPILCSDYMTKEDKIIEQELQVRDMINSILIYNGSVKEGDFNYNEYLRPYFEGNDWRNKELINKKRMQELINEQSDDFSRAITGYAGCDSESVSYKYCRWYDEL